MHLAVVYGAPLSWVITGCVRVCTSPSVFYRVPSTKDGDMYHAALYESCDIPHIVISAKLRSAQGTE